jgi:heat shock protein HslJ
VARWLLPLVLLALLPATASASLKGTSWSFVRSEGKPITDTQARLTFQAHSQWAGMFNCNGYGGRYRERGARLRFTDMRSTAMGCDHPGPCVACALVGARRFRMTERRLYLLGRRGRTLAVLTRR